MNLVFSLMNGLGVPNQRQGTALVSACLVVAGGGVLGSRALSQGAAAEPLF